MLEPTLHYYHLGAGVTAFSTTRHGGYSKGRYGEFNINRYCGDDEQAIGRNRELLCRLLGIDDNRLLMPHQVHLTETAVVNDDLLALATEAQRERLDGFDALMTDVAGVCIGVSTADCIPVLLYDPRHRAVCAIHAGWRGTVLRIVEKAVAKMAAVYGTQPSDVMAQIGPGIGLNSFEVGDEVFEAFAEGGFSMGSISKRLPTTDGMGEKWHIDLPGCNRLQLLSAGVGADHISVLPVCTFQQEDNFFSARRLGVNSGRIFTGIIINSTEATEQARRRCS